jgi:hypothetical protein
MNSSLSVPPKILDQIVMESFHNNQKKLSNMCKVILPSSTSESKSKSNSLSDIDAHELLIKLHAKPLKLFDLKTLSCYRNRHFVIQIYVKSDLI